MSGLFYSLELMMLINQRLQRKAESRVLVIISEGSEEG